MVPKIKPLLMMVLLMTSPGLTMSEYLFVANAKANIPARAGASLRIYTVFAMVPNFSCDCYSYDVTVVATTV